MSETTMSSSSLRVANNAFTNDVYQDLAINTSYNAIISPFSLHMVLGLTFFGAAGSTANAMSKGLRIKHSDTLLKEYKNIMEQFNKSPELTIANTIYFAQDVELNPVYQSQAVEYFKSELRKTDFTQHEIAAKQMNDWVTDHTNGKIKDLVQSGSLTPDSKLVLMNAIHFKGKWATPFQPQHTTNGQFYLDETQSVKVPLMHLTRGFYIYQQTGDDGYQVLELPYETGKEGQSFSMHIFLPNKRTGLSTLEQILFQSEESFADKFGNIAYDANWQEVELTLPRFKIESTWDMNNLCQQLGMSVAFTDKADFSLMTQNQIPLAISQVVQKAVVKVNEEGTEAAVAMRMMMTRKCCLEPPINFTADHPFLVTISSVKDRNILFLAKVAQL